MSLTAKRIVKEIEQLRNDPPASFTAAMINNNLYEWHFTIRGPEDSDYQEGIYHGKIDLPLDYPIKPPNIYFLTPNGRFDIKTKICLSITKFHPENWNPSWTLRVMIEGIIQHFRVNDFGLGSVATAYNSDKIKSLALGSHKWECDVCGPINQLIQPRIKKVVSQEPQKEPENIEQQQQNQEEKQPNLMENKKDEKKENVINEQEIPISKKQSEQLGKILFQQFFNQESQNLIYNRNEQQGQDILNHQQMEYFDKIYKYLEEEEMVTKTLQINKDQSIPQQQHNHYRNPDEKHNPQYITLANLILCTLIFIFAWINVGNFLEQKLTNELLGN